MEFRACCCLKPRSGAVLAGILDTIIGIIGLLGIAYMIFGLENGHLPLHGHEHDQGEPEVMAVNTTGGIPVTANTATINTEVEPASGDNSTDTDSTGNASYANDLATVNYLYAFSALTTLLLGIILLLAAWKKNAGLAKTALVLNLVNILGCIAWTVGLFVFGIHWHVLFPLPIAILVQIYFFWIVLDYQKYFNYSQPLNVKPRA